MSVNYIGKQTYTNPSENTRNEFVTQHKKTLHIYKHFPLTYFIFHSVIIIYHYWDSFGVEFFRMLFCWLFLAFFSLLLFGRIVFSMHSLNFSYVVPYQFRWGHKSQSTDNTNIQICPYSKLDFTQISLCFFFCTCIVIERRINLA